jgi:hypothetical protein
MPETIVIKDYQKRLRQAKPTIFEKKIVYPPSGSQEEIKIMPPMVIPPLNTDIQFSILPKFKLSEHAGLSAIDITQIPETFDWRHAYSSDTEEITKKKRLISTPGNQALCGSCWAISGAGIIGDNFVVSGVVDWKPDLSTTWCLACYPQSQCEGGNPALLFSDISQGGIVSNHCIDYSWCLENEQCNGSSLKHFDQKVSLSSLVPTCGCYFGDTEHYLYKIDKNPKSISIGVGGVDKDNIISTVKKQIYTKGPVMGGFLVFKNFMSGEFTKSNGGVYLERGVYGNEPLKFSDDMLEEYNGSHAIAVIGWGIAKNILVDNGGKRDDVPYWYCRNSWTTDWGDGGYFKMAMFPFNKISQFESIVTISSNGQRLSGGGMVFPTASNKPEKKNIKQVENIVKNQKRLQDDAFYQQDPKNIPKTNFLEDTSKTKKTIIYVFISIIILIFLIWIIRKIL